MAFDFPGISQLMGKLPMFGSLAGPPPATEQQPGAPLSLDPKDNAATPGAPLSLDPKDYAAAPSGDASGANSFLLNMAKTYANPKPIQPVVPAFNFADLDVLMRPRG